ncbi:putative flap endonuclease-1-like 5' DNA nuclease [Saonia flava]|uniref:Putative flap endonuclease-1-like 5' DNA nuclease n=1 Tax=Saonia flava TaxID=523696 RepID=A0A846R1M5_9FLAO|nr:hypothetical protein [Saonia flava]NJB71284.1 putative flap endonuclease-1-like 5' DNA nuclease [Saonia flava]
MNFDFENMNFWCWLIPLLCTLLGALFGYLLGKGRGTTIDNSADLKVLTDKNAKLEADLAACTQKLSAKVTAAPVKVNTPSTKKTTSIKAPAASLAAVPFDADAAKAVFGKKIKQDDLKLVEGIGPKIEGLFHNFNIKTWKALSETKVAKCQEVLNSGGDRYKIHDPASWPLQAKMCYKGEWKKLAKWQDEHKGGRL